MRFPRQMTPENDRSWAVATWWLPFTMELVTGILALVLWMLRRSDHGGGFDRAWFLTGVLITAGLSALASAILWRSSSVRIHGIGLSVAGSAIVLVPVGICVAFVLYS